MRSAARLLWALALMEVVVVEMASSDAERLLAALCDALASDPRLVSASLTRRGISSLQGALTSAFEEGWSLIEDAMAAASVTVVAPTDDAFAAAVAQRRLLCEDALPCSSVDAFFAPPLLRSNLLKHVFVGSYSLKCLPQEGHLHSVTGMALPLESLDGWGVVFGGAEPVSVDAEFSFEFGNVIVVRDVLWDDSGVDASDIGSAENVLAIGPFSEERREALASSVGENLRFYQRIRSAPLDDAAAVPLTFMPQPRSGQSGLTTASCDASAAGHVEWQIPNDVKRLKNAEDLAYLSVLELASLLRQGAVTSVQLTELFLMRLRTADQRLQVVVTYTEELAFRQAERADREMVQGVLRGPLHGIPYGLKDVIAVPGYPTTWGSTRFRDQFFERPAWVYEKLSEAGAVLVAKLATGELALGDEWFGGRTRNPWNVMQSSCGSSAGSGQSMHPTDITRRLTAGAATVAGLVPFAIGTETWGSLSCPASRMGVTAARPTFGAVGRSGTMPLAWSMDKVGSFCRTATDCAVVLTALQGIDRRDPSSVHAPWTDPASLKLRELTVGFVAEAEPTVVRQFEEMGMKLTSVSVNISYPLHEMLNVILAAESSSSFAKSMAEDELQDGQKDDSWPLFVQTGRFVSAAEYLQAMRLRGELVRESLVLLQDYDALLLPTEGTGNQVTWGNLIGIPEVVFPVGHRDIPGREHSRRKDPLTQKLIGAPFAEWKLLGIVAKYQEMTDHHLKRPPLPRTDDASPEPFPSSQVSASQVPPLAFLRR